MIYITLNPSGDIIRSYEESNHYLSGNTHSVINCSNNNKSSQERFANPCHKHIAVCRVLLLFSPATGLFSKVSIASHSKNSPSDSLVLPCSVPRRQSSGTSKPLLSRMKKTTKYDRGTVTWPESFWKSIMRQAIKCWGQGFESSVLEAPPALLQSLMSTSLEERSWHLKSSFNSKTSILLESILTHG